MRLVRLRLPLMFGCLLWLTGCVHQSLPPTLYRLDQAAVEPPVAAGGRSVLLGPLQVADYLQREAIMQRGSDNSLQLSAEARWAGSLSDDIGRLLVNQLAARLGTSRISLYPDRVGFKADVQILLDIGRLDSGPQQPAVLEARWRLLDGDREVQASRLLRLSEPHNGQMADQVRAQSSLLQQLASQIAEAVQKIPPHPAPAPRQSRTSTPERETPAREPQIPVARPQPAAEVYRF